MSVEAKDLRGQRFGALVVSQAVRRGRKPLWECICDCGNVLQCSRWTLERRGQTKCFRCSLEQSRKHGDGHAHPEYRVWSAMRGRCRNPKLPSYQYYGARGIRVCERWNDYRAFLADMGRRPSPRHSIDRIDNDGDYCPENCRWATPREQRLNRRDTKLYEHDGAQRTLSEISTRCGINMQTLWARVHMQGWPIELAVATAVVRGQKLTAEQVRAIKARLTAGATQRELAREYGVDKKNVALIRRGEIWRDA